MTSGHESWLMGVGLTLLLTLACTGGGPTGSRRRVALPAGIEVGVPEGWRVELSQDGTGASASAQDGSAQVLFWTSQVRPEPDPVAWTVWQALGIPSSPDRRLLGPDAVELRGAEVSLCVVVRPVGSLWLAAALAASADAYRKLGGAETCRQLAAEATPAGQAASPPAPRLGRSDLVGFWKTDPATSMPLVESAGGDLYLVSYGGQGEGVELDLRGDGTYTQRLGATSGFMFMEVRWQGRWQASGGVLTLWPTVYEWTPYGHGPEPPPVDRIDLQVVAREGDVLVLAGPCALGSGTPFFAVLQERPQCAVALRRLGLTQLPALPPVSPKRSPLGQEGGDRGRP